MERVLRDWYQDNRIAKHIQLVKGDHTDTYVRCRNLVSEAKLTNFLAAEIAEKYRTQNIRSVIGVGTSSIALAVAIAYRIGCEVTFTFANSLTIDGAPPRHSGFEVPPIVPSLEDGRILVLDDVVSGGRQARAVGNELVRISDGGINLQEQVRHFALFHLGTRELDPQLNIEYFCHIPEVYYADHNDLCQFCQRGEPVTLETDLE